MDLGNFQGQRSLSTANRIKENFGQVFPTGGIPPAPAELPRGQNCWQISASITEQGRISDWQIAIKGDDQLFPTWSSVLLNPNSTHHMEMTLIAYPDEVQFGRNNSRSRWMSLTHLMASGQIITNKAEKEYDPRLSSLNSRENALFDFMSENGDIYLSWFLRSSPHNNHGLLELIAAFPEGGPRANAPDVFQTRLFHMDIQTSYVHNSLQHGPKIFLEAKSGHRQPDFSKGLVRNTTMNSIKRLYAFLNKKRHHARVLRNGLMSVDSHKFWITDLRFDRVRDGAYSDWAVNDSESPPDSDSDSESTSENDI